jgi:MFS family permease
MTADASSSRSGLIGTSSRSYVLLLLTLVYTFNHIDRQILVILLEPIKADLNLNDTQLGLLSGLAFAAFYATLGIPIAMWADRGNRRNIITLALAVWSGMTALSGLAQNYWHLLIARMGVGVGEAGGTRLPPRSSLTSTDRRNARQRLEFIRQASVSGFWPASSSVAMFTKSGVGGPPSSSPAYRACCWPCWSDSP